MILSEALEFFMTYQRPGGQHTSVPLESVVSPTVRQKMPLFYDYFHPRCAGVCVDGKCLRSYVLRICTCTVTDTYNNRHSPEVIEL